MKKMKKIFTTLLCSVVRGFLASIAFGFSLGGYLGPVEFKYDNWEDITMPASAPGINLADGVEDNWGVTRVSTIWSNPLVGSSQLLWYHGKGGEELTGVFGCIDIDRVVVTASGFELDSVSGFMDFYLNPVGSFAETVGRAGRIGSPCTLGYQGITNVAAGSQFMALQFVPGINPALPLITVDGDVDIMTVPGSGDAAAYLAVTDPTIGYGWMFDGDGYLGGLADFYLKNSFMPYSDQTKWHNWSHDPVVGDAVPEPATMLLLGTGLIGLAGFGRKKFFKKA